MRAKLISDEQNIRQGPCSQRHYILIEKRKTAHEIKCNAKKKKKMANYQNRKRLRELPWCDKSSRGDGT